MPSAGRSRIALVVLSHDRIRRLAETLDRATSLPEQPHVIVVDNGSRDGSPEMVASRFPEVELVALARNHGAAARNVGAQRARTPFVAFSDDDTYWLPGSLERACALFDEYPRVGVLSARVVVGSEQREDPTCRQMRESPLPADGLPGPVLVGFLAGASAFRRDAFLRAGGYEPRFFIGAEEGLLALDLMTLGYSIVYAQALVVRHFPASVYPARRNELVVRNDLWTVWLRRHPRVVVRRTLAFAARAAATRHPLRVLAHAARGLPWALRNRRPVPPRVEALCQVVDDWRASQAARPRLSRPVLRPPRARRPIAWHR